MPYPLLDWQSRSLAALLSLPAPWPHHPGWTALRQLLAETLTAIAAKEPSLEAALRVDAGWGVASSTVLETPFVTTDVPVMDLNGVFFVSLAFGFGSWAMVLYALQIV